MGPLVDPEQKYQLSPITLSFQDAGVEHLYRTEEPERLLPYIRPGLVIVILVIGLFGLLDSLIAPELQVTAWQVRLYLALSICAVLVLTYTSLVSAYLQISLFVLVLFFGFSNIALILTVPETYSYFVGLVLIMMYSYFAGLRFIYALLVSSILVAAYIFAALLNDYVLIAATQLPLLLAAFLISGFAGYTAERQRRMLFAQTSFMEEERELHEKLALYDPLTELPNRHLLDERMSQLIARARRQGDQFAVMFVDIDNFKTVNDNYGHVIGDQVLVAIAKRLMERVRTEDTVARLGGDEFVILSEHTADEKDVRIAASRILAEIAEPIVLKLRQSDTITINLTGSLGISVCPRDGTTLQQLVERADDAMYDVKKRGKASFRFFSLEPVPGKPLPQPKERT
jgi:diguanylate cyclase (GGDEF)-like protein